MDTIYMIIGFFVLHSVFGIIGTELAKSKNRDVLEGFIVGFCFSALGLFFYSRVEPKDPDLDQANKGRMEKANEIEKKNIKAAGIIIGLGLFFILIFALLKARN